MRLQDVSAEKVISNLGGSSFLTENGKVVEGNYVPGEYAPVIYDRTSHRYIPAWKKQVATRGPAYDEKREDEGSPLTVKIVAYSVTWVKTSNRIYYTPLNDDKRWYIDLSGIANVEEAYLLKVLETDAMFGVFVYYAGDYCRVIKFHCLSRRAVPEETVEWEGLSYVKSQFDYIIDTFPAVMSPPADIIPILVREVEGWVVKSWEPVSRGYSPAPKCLTVWFDPAGSTLNNLHYEIGAVLIVEWRLVSSKEGEPDVSGSVYIDYLVAYNGNGWQNLGRVYDTVLVYVPNPGAPYLCLNDEIEWYGVYFFNANFICGVKAIWPILNSSGIGVVGYWVCWTYMLGSTFWSTYYHARYPFIFYDMYWWTPTNERLTAGSRRGAGGVGDLMCGDAPSLGGNGRIDRAMSRKTVCNDNGGDILSQYRIAGVYYENNESIPDVIFNPDLYPFGRVSIEMRAVAERLLSFTPAFDVRVAEISRLRELIDGRPIPSVFRVTIIIHEFHKFYWKVGTGVFVEPSKYEVVYEDYYGYPTRLPDQIKWAENPSNQALRGRPHSTQLNWCGFSYRLV